MRNDELQKERVESFLNQPRWNDGKGGTLNWIQRISKLAILGKSKHVEKYSKVKRNGTYAILKNPKTLYYIDYREGSEDFSLEVPKIVWDNVIAVEHS